MSRKAEVQERLLAIAAQLKTSGLWQSVAPETEAFASTEPFCLDSMAPLQWLQWVFLPRMQALLESGAPLPVTLAIAPYYEVALDAETAQRTVLLQRLSEFDQLFEPPK